MENYSAILLNVPIELLKRLTKAAAAMEISRSELIRRALRRDVEFVLREEIPCLLASKEKTMADYSRWLSYRL